MKKLLTGIIILTGCVNETPIYFDPIIVKETRTIRTANGSINKIICKDMYNEEIEINTFINYKIGDTLR